MEEASKQKGGEIKVKMVIQNKTILVNICPKSYHVAGISILKKIKNFVHYESEIKKQQLRKIHMLRWVSFNM